MKIDNRDLHVHINGVEYLGYHMTANITKSLHSHNDIGVVAIRNMSHVGVKRDDDIEVYAGRVSNGDQLLAKGLIVGITSESAGGSDTTTTITFDGAYMRDKMYTGSFKKGTSIRRVVRVMLLKAGLVTNNVPDLGVTQLNLNLAGNLSTIMDKLADKYYFRWNINDGYVSVVDVLNVQSKWQPAAKLYADEINSDSVKVHVPYDPIVECGMIYDSVTGGEYIIDELKYRLSNYSDEWNITVGGVEKALLQAESDKFNKRLVAQKVVATEPIGFPEVKDSLLDEPIDSVW